MQALRTLCGFPQPKEIASGKEKRPGPIYRRSPPSYLHLCAITTFVSKLVSFLESLKSRSRDLTFREGVRVIPPPAKRRHDFGPARDEDWRIRHRVDRLGHRRARHLLPYQTPPVPEIHSYQRQQAAA